MRTGPYHAYPRPIPQTRDPRFLFGRREVVGRQPIGLPVTNHRQADQSRGDEPATGHFSEMLAKSAVPNGVIFTGFSLSDQPMVALP